MVVDMIVKAFRVYGKEGHRFRGSFFETRSLLLSGVPAVIMNVINSDITGTNEYSVLKFTCMFGELPNEAFEHMAEVQAYDGIFECCTIGDIVEVPLYDIKIRCGRFTTFLNNLTIEEVSKIRKTYNEKCLFFSIHRQ
jgi:hypothetical protein